MSDPWAYLKACKQLGLGPKEEDKTHPKVRHCIFRVLKELEPPFHFQRRRRRRWDTETSGTLTPKPTAPVLVLAVCVVTLMELSESMGSCAAGNAFTAMPRRLVSSSTVDLH
nr:hypothetical protein [Tanacetum cinerariifolium]